MKAEGIPLLDRVKNKGLNDSSIILESTNSNSFVFFVNPKTKKSGVFMNTGEGKNGNNRFVRLGSMFKNKSVYTLGATLNIAPNLQDTYNAAAIAGVNKLERDINKSDDNMGLFETCSR